MLSVAHRLRSSTEFTEVVRRGRRAGRPTLTVHLLPPSATEPSATEPAAPSAIESTAPARAGLVVSKAVGGSVVRHQVARRLRHLLRDRMAGLPVGSRLVVRAAPAAGSASSQLLGADLDAALSRLAGR